MKRIILLFLAIGTFAFHSCKKDGLPALDWNPKWGPAAGGKAMHESPVVATDWYNFQLRLLLEK